MAILSTFAGRTSATAYAYGVDRNAPQGLLVLAGSSATSSSYTLTCQPQKSANPNAAVCVPTTTTPITVGQGSVTETVTPSAVSTDGLGNILITATFTYGHQAGDVVRSGTYGLQEALNAVSGFGGGVVVIDGAWAKLGGTQAILEAATIPASVSIEDLRNGGEQNSATLTLTAAQVNTMFTTPVELLPAPAAGSFYVVNQAILINENGGTAWTGGGAITIGYSNANPGSPDALSGTIAATFLTTPTVKQIITLAGAQIASAAESTVDALGIFISNAGAVFATGTGTLKVKLLYSVVTT
jgi:hypothetical protein